MAQQTEYHTIFERIIGKITYTMNKKLLRDYELGTFIKHLHRTTNNKYNRN